MSRLTGSVGWHDPATAGHSEFHSGREMASAPARRESSRLRQCPPAVGASADVRVLALSRETTSPVVPYPGPSIPETYFVLTRFSILFGGLCFVKRRKVGHGDREGRH